MSTSDIEDRKKACANADVWVDENINTWADIYKMIHGKMNSFYAQPTEAGMQIALYTMYAFVMTMEDLPEEGEALAIAKHMNHIMFMEPERMGASLLLINEEDIERTGKVLRALGTMGSTHGGNVVAKDEPQEGGDDIPLGKNLH